jgi:hypothetical protein
VARSFFRGNSSSSYVKPFDPATELGVQEPVGFWDPLGFTADGNEATFKRRRSVELKHGRVSMAAAMGYITPKHYKFPLVLVSVTWHEVLGCSQRPDGAQLSPKLRRVQLISFLEH